MRDNSTTSDVEGGATTSASSQGPLTSAPSLTETSITQMQISVATTSLIRAAEEIMLLTRTMKELWLFGGLDTIRTTNPEYEQEERKLKEQESEVIKGLVDYLASRSNNDSLSNGHAADDTGEETMMQEAG